ncbi:Adenosylcobinamide-phosphate synthase [Chitinispirillum alkaliphilum]|nr:Adenosylcobinamide-phosphate synthase [Chitinispirillum alkaliphilum]
MSLTPLLYMHPLSLIIAVFLDLLLGDPRWLPHPIRWIGSLITAFDKSLFPSKRNGKKEFFRGVYLWLLVIVTTASLTSLLLFLGKALHIRFVLEIIIAFYCLSARSLSKESMKVLTHLRNGEIVRARYQLSTIVGRDTEKLGEEQIIRATVETVGENITDGIIAPLFYLAIGGPVLGLVYKAISTMDSMIGYKNSRYKNFGTCSARADDLFNFVPARLTGFLLIPFAALICRLNWRQSIYIALRDRKKHQSPNSAHGESAVAGALGIQLGGVSTYGGVESQKPFLGDRLRPLCLTDIVCVNTILFCATIFSSLLATSWLIFRGIK